MSIRSSDSILDLDFVTQHHEVKEALKTAHACVSFWGSRIVYVEGHREGVSLEEIVQRVVFAIDRQQQKGTLNSELHSTFRDILEHCFRLDRNMLAKAADKNGLSRLFHHMKKPSRFIWEVLEQRKELLKAAAV